MISFQILSLQPRISKVFLDHQNNFFSQQVRTILVTKYHSLLLFEPSEKFKLCVWRNQICFKVLNPTPKGIGPIFLLISHHSRLQTLCTVYQLSEYIQAKTQINYTSAVCYLVLVGKFCFFTIILQHCVKNFFFKKIF